MHVPRTAVTIFFGCYFYFSGEECTGINSLSLFLSLHASRHASPPHHHHHPSSSPIHPSIHTGQTEHEMQADRGSGAEGKACRVLCTGARV